MRYILLVFSGLLLSLSAYAQDLNYQEVLQAFSLKELPKSKQIKSYQAIDNKVYSIGDKLQIGYPKDGKKFSYISNAPSNLPTSVVTIQSFAVMNAIAGLGSAISIGAVVLSIENNKALFINNIDLALEYGEVVRITKSNVTNFQEMAPNSSSSQVTTNHTSYQAVDNNISEQVVAQKTSKQPIQDNSAGAEQKMVYFDSPTSETSTSAGVSQKRLNIFGFGASKKSDSNNGYVAESQIKGYGGIAIADIGFDALNIGMSLGVSVINGYHFNSNWYVGGGVGVLCYVGGAGYSSYESYSSYGYGYSYHYENYYYEDVNSVCVPIFAYGKYTFTIPKKVWPYVALGLGVNISSYSSVYMNVSGGIAIRMKKEKQHLKVGLSFPMDFANGIGMGVQVGYSF